MDNIVLDRELNYEIECETEILTQYARPAGFKIYWAIEDTDVSGDTVIAPDGSASMSALLMWMFPPTGEHWLSLSHDDFATGLPTAFTPENLARRKITIIDSAAGLDHVATDAIFETARYNLQGQPLASPQPGLNIIHYSNGTTRKVWVK